MNRVVLIVLALLFSVASHAAGPRAVRKTVEGSMLVTGWVMIDPDGSVNRLDLDERAKLPEGVAGLVEEAASSWKFEPTVIDGVARNAKARMSLRIVAKKVDAENYQIAIRGGYFGEEAIKPDERVLGEDSIRKLSMKPPTYPQSAAEVGARGTVYLIVKVGQQGTVENVFAEQVNLRIVGSDNDMKRLREVFAKSARNAARSWTFQLPTKGEHAHDSAWLVRVPVDYAFHGENKPEYGEWEVYVPGPIQSAPWQTEKLDPNQTPDSLIAGGVYEVGKGLRLMNAIQ